MSKLPAENEITQYIAELNRIYKAGNATEHSYRPALKSLLEKITTDKGACPLVDSLVITNEPKRIACGAPDYIVTRKEIPIGYIEAKDIDTDLNNKLHKPQFDRYKQSLNNLIITDYLTFQLFENDGRDVINHVPTVTIAKTGKNGIEADKTQFENFVALINLFVGYQGQGIQNSVQLSKMMAAKARLMSNSIEKALDSKENADDNSLIGQLNGFREVLIEEISHKEFADMYAQTIAYGMFAAKLNDLTPSPSPKERGDSPPSEWLGEGLFTRSKAAQLIPHSNPFLRKFFQYIAGYDLDERICWIVDDLADLFNYVDINVIIKEFSKTDHDPIIHFYETFLSEYDPALRKSRGVWYTPKPVVQFIVQAVDDILKQDFGISQGLADMSKVKLKQYIKQEDSTLKEEEKEYHRVQILDPATGTGTFLAEVVQNIYERFKNQRGMWQNYASEHLLPRINGFEILMASYAMAHLKIDMLLKQTNYKHTNNERLRIFLTNSLDEARAKTEFNFAKWLTDEANAANRIKQDVPVMVVLGNPPYSVSTQNKSKWINNLLADYKKGLSEKNIQPLSDDYIKFIRFGQYFIEKNGEGILAYISNNSFIDGLIHKQMRKNLLETFDKIYILDLHGNSKKKETVPDGSKDENVFDIMQGVSINIFVKSHKDKGACPLVKPPACVFHYDLYGKRTEKFSFLLNNNLKSVKWQQINYFNHNCFFVPKNYEIKEEYDKGFKVNELFPVNSCGIVTQRDDASIKFSQEECNIIKNDIINLSNEKLSQKYDFVDTRDWTVNAAKKDMKTNVIIANKLHYRPFDFRFMNYTGKIKGVMGYPRYAVMQHFLKNENVGLVLERIMSNKNIPYRDVFITNIITDKHNTGSAAYIFPLYLYIKNGIADDDKRPYHKHHNLNKTIIDEISKRLGLHFFDDSDENSLLSEGAGDGKFTPLTILDYIYAVLHSPSYREKYKEFLKIDFPRVPYPENAEQFWKLVDLGGKLRRLHLLEDVEPQDGIADFPIAGSDEVEKPSLTPSPSPKERGDSSPLERLGEVGRVYINDTQYFDHVPTEAWNFYIGGYQPAQKWLKDRKGLKLSYDDIVHYQKIIRALKETGDVMQEVDVNMKY